MLTTTHIISVEKFLIAVFVGARVPKLSVRIMNKRVLFAYLSAYLSFTDVNTEQPISSLPVRLIF